MWAKLAGIGTVAMLVGLVPDIRPVRAESPPIRSVEGQPLASNVERILTTLQFLGAPLPEPVVAALGPLITARDAVALQQTLDPLVLFVVSINPELRVKVARGESPARIQQHGFTPVLVKVLNEGTVTGRLNIGSPQGGTAYLGVSELSLQRQRQTELLHDPKEASSRERYFTAEMLRTPPMTPELSGLEVEYAIALVSSTESGRREAIVSFDVGQGTQDLGFRAEVPVLFDVQPAVPVRLTVRDHDGSPTTARLTIRDPSGRVFPAQVKRTAPDFFFQPHIYRRDGQSVLLPPGRFHVTYSRGPEYVVEEQTLEVSSGEPATLDLSLRRWVDPSADGFYVGDHHIHGAGCAHYESPTLGVSPSDMFLQVQGEGLNVGCVLTWGPCFEFQRNYFSPQADDVSQPLTVLKYDLEISGFGSAPLGHVCLLNLRDQTYPGSDGEKDRGWPTWTVPVLRWAKQQGGVTGFPHSAMDVQPKQAANRLFERFDADRDAALTRHEAAAALLPHPFDTVDASRDGRVEPEELTASADRAADELPNLVVPEMSGGGAMEIVVAVPEGVCDFISAMDTARIGEWNTWYHLLNCGFPLKLSGETDFPCMSSRRVGQGRVYVQLGQVARIDFAEWCGALAAGRSYVSDGYAHAVEFTVNGVRPGYEELRLDRGGPVQVQARVAFAEEVPEGVAYGTQPPPQGARMIGDTRELHLPRSTQRVRTGMRLVEIVVNGQSVAQREVPANGQPHTLSFEVPVHQSSWIALRHFPQLHTNPVTVLVGGRPIRASRESALWCDAAVEQLWSRRSHLIAPAERAQAQQAYERARRLYQTIAAEAGTPPGHSSTSGGD
jgi:hypothetical protein